MMSKAVIAPGPYSDSLPSASQFATFVIAGFYFGIDVLQVQEVLKYQEMTPVPLAPEVIEGLINLRGQIVTAVDMRRRLGLPPRPEGRASMNVVVRTIDGTVSLVVDEIGDVVEVDCDGLEHPPENLDPAVRDLVAGIHKLKDKLLLVLNINQMLNFSASQHGRAC